jgi:hypothetical protein
VYTAQGFEFDYVGVIFGPDLVYRPMDGGWIGNRDEERSFRGLCTQVLAGRVELQSSTGAAIRFSRLHGVAAATRKS